MPVPGPYEETSRKCYMFNLMLLDSRSIKSGTSIQREYIQRGTFFLPPIVIPDTDIAPGNTHGVQDNDSAEEELASVQTVTREEHSCQEEK